MNKTQLDKTLGTIKNYISSNYAAKSHTHNNIVMNNCSNVDFNTIKTAGFYYGYTGMTNAAKQAISVLEVIVYSPDWIVQRQTIINGNGETYERHYYEGNKWSTWKKIYDTKNKPTLSELGAAASGHTHNYAGSSSAGGAANSAAKLQTARTINGTSFDGSANITTANWGTARTLTIGNKAQSVNGSQNITWSLSDIGAAASSHGHTSINRTFITTPIYNAQTGVLIDFNLNEKSGAMVILKLYGNSYSSNPPIEAIYQFYDYSGGNLHQPGGSAISGPAINLKVFKVGGKIKAWFKQPNDYCTFKVEVTYGNNSSTPNITLTNAAEPATGITETLSITPNRVYSAAYKPTPADIGAAAASHGTHLTLGTGSGNAFRGDYGNTAYNHSRAAHAPSNAQKNSDITKAEIEAKLTGNITSHTHSYAGSSSAGGNANAAVKLATARTINGTNFNGTGNITTANWGTARTITIGKTSKSVNGSGNVTWSLGEIGARDNAYPQVSNWFNGTPIIQNDGVMDIGKYIDFHYIKNSSSDFDVRLEASSGGLFISNNFLPSAHNKQSLGSITSKWNECWVNSVQSRAVFSVDGSLQTSDARYKSIIDTVDTKECFDMIKNTNVYSYTMIGKDVTKMSEKELRTAEKDVKDESIQMGILAQDLLPYECSRYILTQDLKTDSEGNVTDTYAINPYNFASAIMAALKEEISKREAAEERIVVFEKENQELKDRLAKIEAYLRL